MKNENDNLNFPEAHFDVLLQHALLANEKNFTLNENNMETMAQQTFALVNVKDISEVKGNSLIEKLAADFRSRNRLWLNIFFLALLVGAGITAINFFGNRNNNENKNTVLVPGNGEEKKTAAPLPSINAEEVEKNPLPVINPAVLALIDTSEETRIAQLINEKPENYIPTTLHIPEEKSLAYEEIPVLSEAVKKQTAKDKMKMIRDIANPKKKIYSIIPSGKTSVNGVMTNVPAFFIKNSEVTNFEYRTFLNDLLIQGKYDDYLLAKPVSGGWKAAGIPLFEDHYFESEKYNDFPAVNMTRKGAELYCTWLTNSVNAAVDNKDIKQAAYDDFRIPTSQEWIYAARGADSTALKYPWGRYIPDSVQNARGCFLCNFNYTASEDYFKGMKICPGFGKLKQGGFHQPIITTAGMAIDTLLTAPVYSYNPNTTGQYCMMGNVSEMTWSYFTGAKSGGRTALALGGNWNSYVDNVQIEAVEQYNGIEAASAYIGFRPIMTFLEKK